MTVILIDQARLPSNSSLLEMRWGLQMLHFIFSFAVIAAIRYVQFYNPRFAIHDVVVLFLESTFKVDQTVAAMTVKNCYVHI